MLRCGAFSLRLAGRGKFEAAAISSSARGFVADGLSQSATQALGLFAEWFSCSFSTSAVFLFAQRPTRRWSPPPGQPGPPIGRLRQQRLVEMACAGVGAAAGQANGGFPKPGWLEALSWMYEDAASISAACGSADQFRCDGMSGFGLLRFGADGLHHQGGAAFS